MLSRTLLIGVLGLEACAAPQNRRPQTAVQRTQASPDQGQACDERREIAFEALPSEAMFGADEGSAVIVETTEHHAIVATTFSVADAQMMDFMNAPHIDVGPGEDTQLTTRDIVYTNAAHNLALYRFPRRLLRGPAVTLRKYMPGAGSKVAALGDVGHGVFDFVIGEVVGSRGRVRLSESPERAAYVVFDGCGRLVGLVDDLHRGGDAEGDLIPAAWIAEALDTVHHPRPAEELVRETVHDFGSALTQGKYSKACLFVSYSAFWRVDRFRARVESGEAKLDAAQAVLPGVAPQPKLLDSAQRLELFGAVLTPAERLALQVRDAAPDELEGARTYWGLLLEQEVASEPKLVSLEVEQTAIDEMFATTRVRLEFEDGVTRRESVELGLVGGRFLFTDVDRSWWRYQPADQKP